MSFVINGNLELEHTSKTESSRRQFIYSSILKSFHYLVESGTCFFLCVVREPRGDVEITSWLESVCRDRITIEVIRDNGLNRMEIRWFWHNNGSTDFETISSKVVSEELERFALDSNLFLPTL